MRDQMRGHWNAKTLLVWLVTIFNYISNSILIKILIFQSSMISTALRKSQMKCDWNINILIIILWLIWLKIVTSHTKKCLCVLVAPHLVPHLTISSLDSDTMPNFRLGIRNTSWVPNEEEDLQEQRQEQEKLHKINIVIC